MQELKLSQGPAVGTYVCVGHEAFQVSVLSSKHMSVGGRIPVKND